MGTRPQHKIAYQKLCTLLRQWRLDAELTQRDLGRKLKRPHTYVHKTETGDRRIDPVEFVDWARKCGLDPADAWSEVGRL